MGRSAVRPALSDCWEANKKGPTRDGALLVVRVSPCDPLPRRPAALRVTLGCPVTLPRDGPVSRSLPSERVSVTQDPAHFLYV